MKKLLSLVLAVLLLCGALPLAAHAATDVTASFTDANFRTAVLAALGKPPGGNRRFILVEMEDYAERITAERDLHYSLTILPQRNISVNHNPHPNTGKNGNFIIG